jgi:hypothetical protein
LEAHDVKNLGKCSFDRAGNPPKQCGAWASHEVAGKSYCRHHPSQEQEKSNGKTLLEEVVWDALKNSRCPAKHRYQGPSAGLPCRWCRAAHVVMVILEKVRAGEVMAQNVVQEFEEQLGWTLKDPVIGEKIPFGAQWKAKAKEEGKEKS